MTLRELRRAVAEKAMDAKIGYDETGDLAWKAVSENMVWLLGLIDTVEPEPVGNPDKMTLTELAHELRKIFRFKYLTAESVEGKIVALWDGKPFFTGYEWHFTDKAQCIIDIRFHHIPVLDLSEYKDADGDIDYSKCIVEVE